MSTHVYFLEVEDVLTLHQQQIEIFGGALGLRDRQLLESAVAMPIASFGGTFLHRDIFEMAAAYLFHIAQNHPFLDGNKRAAAVTAVVFLKVNGLTLYASQSEYTELVLSVARGEAQKPAIADFFRQHTAPASS